MLRGLLAAERCKIGCFVVLPETTAGLLAPFRSETSSCVIGRSSARELSLYELTLDPQDATSDEAGVPLLDVDYLLSQLKDLDSAENAALWASQEQLERR
jgi:hypothetical protein